MKPASRHRARIRAIQAIYSWQLSGNSFSDVDMELLSAHDIFDVDETYFHELLSGVVTNVLVLDEKMKPYLSRRINELGQIEKAILRLAMFEIYYCDDVPYKVSINEAIELAKIFGAEESYKFINGSLDKVISAFYKK